MNQKANLVPVESPKTQNGRNSVVSLHSSLQNTGFPALPHPTGFKSFGVSSSSVCSVVERRLPTTRWGLDISQNYNWIAKLQRSGPLEKNDCIVVWTLWHYSPPRSLLIPPSPGFTPTSPGIFLPRAGNTRCSQ